VLSPIGGSIHRIEEGALDMHPRCIYMEQVGAHRICVARPGDPVGKESFNSLGSGMMRADFDVVAFSEIQTWNLNRAVFLIILDTRLPGTTTKNRSRKSTVGNPWSGGSLLMARL
jgi:hypothetical protein